MRAVPAFQLTLGLSAVERSALALLAAVVAASLVSWGWSHVEVAAGAPGRDRWPWLALVCLAAGAGAFAGWRLPRQAPCVLRWQDGRWSWADGTTEHDGTVQPQIDLGAWLLVLLRSRQGAVRWAAVGRRRAGPAWHPLRATLFAPGAAVTKPDSGKGPAR